MSHAIATNGHNNNTAICKYGMFKHVVAIMMNCGTMEMQLSKTQFLDTAYTQH